MSLRKIFVAVAAIAALGVAAAGMTAQAYAAVQTADQKALIDAAKAQGIVGEQADGYVGVRVPAQADAALRAAVEATNAGRRAVYAQSAAAAGTTADVAGARMFESQLYPRLAPGQWYRNAQGQWVQR